MLQTSSNALTSDLELITKTLREQSTPQVGLLAQAITSEVCVLTHLYHREQDLKTLK